MSKTIDHLTDIYVGLCKTAQAKPADAGSLLENGKLRKLWLPCPGCVDEDENPGFGETPLRFDWESHTFGCVECDAEYTALKLLEAVVAKTDVFVRMIEGYVVLLPHLDIEEKKV